MLRGEDVTSGTVASQGAVDRGRAKGVRGAGEGQPRKAVRGDIDVARAGKGSGNRGGVRGRGRAHGRGLRR